MANALAETGKTILDMTTDENPMGEEAKVTEEAKKAAEMEVDEAVKVAQMDMEDNLTSKKETTVKMMAQRLAEMKKRKGGRADAELNSYANKDDDSEMKMTKW